MDVRTLWLVGLARLHRVVLIVHCIANFLEEVCWAEIMDNLDVGEAPVKLFKRHILRLLAFPWPYARVVFGPFSS